MREHGVLTRAGSHAREAVVVDMRRGPEREWRWLDFRTIEPDGYRIATARLRGGQDMPLVMPNGWTSEGSVTAAGGFTRNEEMPRELVDLRVMSRRRALEAAAGRGGEGAAGERRLSRQVAPFRAVRHT